MTLPPSADRCVAVPLISSYHPRTSRVIHHKPFRVTGHFPSSSDRYSTSGRAEVDVHFPDGKPSSRVHDPWLLRLRVNRPGPIRQVPEGLGLARLDVDRSS